MNQKKFKLIGTDYEMNQNTWNFTDKNEALKFAFGFDSILVELYDEQNNELIWSNSTSHQKNTIFSKMKNDFLKFKSQNEELEKVKKKYKDIKKEIQDNVYNKIHIG